MCALYGSQWSLEFRADFDIGRSLLGRETNGDLTLPMLSDREQFRHKGEGRDRLHF